MNDGPPHGCTLRSSTATIANQWVASHPCLCRCNSLCWFAPHARQWTGLSYSAFDWGTSPTSIHFPLGNFKHSLTLFPNSFSPFPHGTCSLLVSFLYLAFDGIYHPFRATFPNNPTSQQHLMVQQGPGLMGLSPSQASPSKRLEPSPPLRMILQTTIWLTLPPDSHAELFPVRSSLLGESL